MEEILPREDGEALAQVAQRSCSWVQPQHGYSVFFLKDISAVTGSKETLLGVKQNNPLLIPIPVQTPTHTIQTQRKGFVTSGI